MFILIIRYLNNFAGMIKLADLLTEPIISTDSALFESGFSTTDGRRISTGDPNSQSLENLPLQFLNRKGYLLLSLRVDGNIHAVCNMHNLFQFEILDNFCMITHILKIKFLKFVRSTVFSHCPKIFSLSGL